MPDLIGQTIGHYRIVEKIGEGGMGEVYRARDESLDRDVAIKVLPEEVAKDSDRLRRFEREAKALAALNHPNIATVHGFETLEFSETDVGAGFIPARSLSSMGEESVSPEAVHILVMELLEGESLRELISKGGITTGKAVEYAGAIADGLAAAHDKGITHRDLKPENVFLTRDGRIKILDFGLAKQTPPEEDLTTETPTQTMDTAPGGLIGTIPYMAPEQVQGQPADQRSDIFALGVVLYEMLTGHRPFGGSTSVETAAAILKEDPEPISTVSPNISPGLGTVVAKCLEKRPEDRFSSAHDLSLTLGAIDTAAPESPAGAKMAPPLAQAPDDRPSAAVLPFANISADPEQEFFCDGISEEIINALAKVQGLRVIARTSAFAFKGRHEDVRQIGSALDVGAIVEGSVRKAGDRLRITAQLIDARDGSHLWSERFDRRLEDVFAIQDEIALAVVENLEVKLLGRERAAVVKRHTENLQAHNAYLIGLFEWNKMTPESLTRCQELLREAIDLDPEFAPPYALLADSFTSVTWWSDQPPKDALSEALPLAEKALAIDPELAHAHCVQGQCSSFFEDDWAAGERSMRRAVELAPNDALAQTYLALLLMMKQKTMEASERARTALRLDPLSPANTVWAGIVLLFSGQPVEGLSVIERQVATTPDLWMPSYWLSVGLASGGRFEEARTAAEKAVELTGGSSLTQCNLALICYQLADGQAGNALFDRLRQRANEGYVSHMFLAWLHLARGEPDAALNCAKEALAAKDPWFGTHRVYSPSLVPGDPRVDDLVASVFR